MILFTVYDLFTMNIYDGNGRKTPKYVQTKTKEKFPVWLPSYPPVYEKKKWSLTVFRCPKTPKTSRTYPRWDGGPSLTG